MTFNFPFAKSKCILFGCNADCEFHHSISETTTIYHMHFLKPCSTEWTLHTPVTQTENKPPLPSTYRFHGWLMTCRVMSSQLEDQSPPIARTSNLNFAAPAVLPVLCNQAYLLSVMLHMLSRCCLWYLSTGWPAGTHTNVPGDGAVRLQPVPERLRSSAAPITGKDSSAVSLWGYVTAPTD